MASIHEEQKTDMLRVDVHSHDTTQTLSKQMQHVGTQVKETVQDMGTQAKEAIQAAGPQIYEQGRESFEDLSQALETQIRTRPVQALLIAGGVGVLLGLLWRRS